MDDGSRYSNYKLYKYAYLIGNSYGYGYSRNKKKGEAEKYFHYYEDDTEI